MAERPIFVPVEPTSDWVDAVPVQLTWHPGFSIKQKQASINALHSSFRELYGKDRRVLEISRRSPDPIGQKLSAFALTVQLPGTDKRISVESAFQGSKKFSGGGPYQDLYLKSAREAKTDQRLRSSGHLEAFIWVDQWWPLQPTTAFYDWLYIQALLAEPSLAAAIMEYDAFSDIEFNPAKSLNCQARTAAFYKSLVSNGVDPATLRHQSSFLELYKEETPGQLTLF